MNELSNPQLYPWTKSEIAKKLEKSLQDELKLESNEMYKALIEATARMAEISTERTNDVPDKAYRTFLDFAGSDYLPAAPATTPVQFTVSNSIGELQKETIAKGFQISGSEEEGKEQIFETTDDITVQKQNLESIKFVDYYRNLATDHSKLIEVDPEVAEAQRLLKGKEPFTYKIHLEHPRFSELGPESAQDLHLKINFDEDVQNKWTSAIFEIFDFEVTYQGEEQKETIKFDSTKNEITEEPRFVILKLPIQRPVTPKESTYDSDNPIIYAPTFVSTIQETELTCTDKTSKKGFFLTVHIKPKLSQLLTTPSKVEENVSLDEAIKAEKLIPTVESIEYCFNDIREGTNISRAFFNSQELDLSAGFMPFGEQPQVNDCFYFAAPEIFESGYKDETIKISTKIMGDLAGTKYANENDPELLPICFESQTHCAFLLKPNEYLKFSIETSISSNSFSLTIYNYFTEKEIITYKDLIINHVGQVLTPTGVLNSEYVTFHCVKPNAVPIDYEITDLYLTTPINLSYSHVTSGNSFTLKKESSNNYTYQIETVYENNYHAFRLTINRQKSNVLYIDNQGTIRERRSNEVFIFPESIETTDIIPNSIPKPVSGSWNNNSDLSFQSKGEQSNGSFELQVIKWEDAHYTNDSKRSIDEEPYHYKIEAKITDSTKTDFKLELILYYLQLPAQEFSSSSQYYQFVESKTFHLFIDNLGILRNVQSKSPFNDEGQIFNEFWTIRLSTYNGLFETIPLEGTYPLFFSYPNWQDEENYDKHIDRVRIPQATKFFTHPLTLSYEYFDGNDWRNFDTYKVFKYLHLSGQFECSLDALKEVTKTTVNGIEDWWIRARIIKGGYGNPAGFQNVSPHPGWLYVLGDTGDPHIENYETDKDNPRPILDIPNPTGPPLKYSFVGPAAPLVEEVPESFKPPIIREMRIQQECKQPLASYSYSDCTIDPAMYTKFGSEAYWYQTEEPEVKDSKGGPEFVVRKDGSVYHELPSGITNFEAATFDKKAKDLYEDNISYYIPDTEDATRVDLPGKFPIVEVPNDNTGSFPAVYFGFKGDKLEGTYNSLFLSLEEVPFYYRKDEVITKESETSSSSRSTTVVSEEGIPQYTKSNDVVSRVKASLSWQYFGNNGWQELPVEDKTFGFTKSNNIGFTFPVDAQKSTVLSETNYWIRAVVIDPELTPLNSVALKGAYQNTVLATNLTTVRNERLGSSNGKENQAFKLRFAPVVGDLRLFVGEVDMITEKELQELFTDKNGTPFEQATDEMYSQFVAHAVSVAKDDNDSVLGVSVEWNRVDTFAHSKPNSRHYMFDHVTGDILFGDGVNGMIPDFGRENIIAHHYQYGGGTGGNVPYKTIDKMRNRAQIVSKVTNIANGSGGGNRENISDLLKRGSSDLRTHDRAVTVEDYEILAKKATTNVAKAIAKSSHHPDGSVGTGNVTISILTHDRGEKPMPSARVLDYVKHYIAERSPMQIQDTKNALRETRNKLPEELKKASFYSQYNAKVEVIPPNYVTVGVNAKLHFTNPDEAQDVTSSIEAELATFLHPLHGNYGRGWNFGESFTAGIIEQFIRRQNGVKGVTDVSIAGSQLLLNLKLSLPEDWDTNLPSWKTIKAGQFIDLYGSKSIDYIYAPDIVRLQVANNVTISKKAEMVKIVGFTEGDTIELLSTTPIYNVEPIDTYNSIINKILATGRISGFSKSYTFPSCTCQDVPRTDEERTEPCTCGCLPDIPDITMQQPIYYIDVDLMHLDSVSKAVLPAIYENDGNEEIKIQGKTLLYEKLKQITNLEVRTIRGYSEEPQQGNSNNYYKKTHAIKAKVSEVFTADGRSFSLFDDTPFKDLTGEIDIVKIGIMFPSFINTNTVLHPMFQGAEEPIKLKTYSVDPEIKTIHLTDWDLPCAGEFSISDASTTNQTENEE